MAVQKPLAQRVVVNLRKKWLQVFLSVVVLAGWVQLMPRLLGPKKLAQGEKQKTDEFKFLHCERCNLEIPFNEQLNGRPCTKCVAPNTGYFVPTKNSIKSGSGDASPWIKYNYGLILTSISYLGLLYYILSRPVEPPRSNVFVSKCLHCGEYLKYGPDGHSRYVECPKCVQLLKLPDEDEALTADDHNEDRVDKLLTKLETELGMTALPGDAGAGPPSAKPAGPTSRGV